ncbi:MAG TPA: Na+/H+ antiporter NhaA [Gaiellaceae bacterium]|jgi:Na+/H+ antiporter NhaA
MSEAVATPLVGRTAWARNLETPLRQFLRTQVSSAAVLLTASIVALVWANADPGSYSSAWHTTLAIRIGHTGVTQDLRSWVNSGLMTFFFFVIGLEARREFDMGELRERRRFTVPLVAGMAGMALPASIYVLINAGHSTVHGWGVAMSTDTAFALGMLALVGPRFPDRLRAFMLTVSVVDDLLALCVIAFVYSGHIALGALAAAIGIFVAILIVRAAGVRRGAAYGVLGLAAWVALQRSGVDPIVIGLALGLLTYAYPASRSDLERATDLFRSFREQPTPELAREAQVGLTAAISPNLRLQELYAPWASYVIVPLFGLANAGVHLSGSFLAHAYGSRVTLGIIVAYLVGKPVGVTGSALLVTKLSKGRVRPPVGWAAVAGGGAIAGIGFTVSLLIASLAFTGEHLQEAKVGVLTSALCASLLTWLVFRATARLPRRLAIRALVGSAEPLIDLAVPVDAERDHIRGPADAKVTLVEYGDFECSYCGLAEPTIREVLADFGDVQYVWRHLPLNDVHPYAQVAAEAAEAAAAQDAFWPMHDLLLAQEDLRGKHVTEAAKHLGLDVERFSNDLREHAGAARIAEDVDSADLSGVSGTPTFFINGKRHNGAYDIDALSTAVRAARVRATVVKK